MILRRSPAKPRSSLQEILRQLPSLTKKELEEIRLKAGALLSLSSEAPPSALTEDWLLDGITLELRRRGLWLRTYPIPKKLLPDGYSAKASAVRSHLLKGVGTTVVNPAQRMSLGELAGSALADFLLRRKVPVGPKTLLGNVEKVPGALEEAFPGYWEQGLLGFCLMVRR